MLQRGGLLLDPAHDFGMAVPARNRRNPGDQVEVAPAGFVEDILHASLDDHQRVAVQRKDGGVDMLAAQCEHLLARWTQIGARGVRKRRHR